MEACWIHRDFRMDQLCFDDTERTHLRVVDLGLSTPLDGGGGGGGGGGGSTRVKRRGDQLYLSPENNGQGRVGAPHDMWAVGLVLCQLLTGDHLHEVNLGG